MLWFIKASIPAALTLFFSAPHHNRWFVNACQQF
jgi:hypothetical protein